ncbi:MAG: DNA polymerase III subunit gamma and tau [Tetrasphaera sp.]|nr:DNA polymerase III subunit gamma and tau [Tetrasphaera sp.]
MSTALYRRYRPDTFADVIGQEHVTVPLARALDSGRINHAYLFSGPRGCGKTTSARILARCLNCERGPTSTPCGECDSCVALARGGAGSIDVIEIDAASHGGVDDARDLRERAAFAPAESRFKVYIIDEAHMVTTQGFNALLKIVEEPPEHVKFVFATTEPEKVIGTIRSRTHHYPFRLVPPARLHDYLGQLCVSEQVDVEPGVLSFVVRAGGGSVRDALSVLDQLIAGSDARGLTYDGAAALLGFTDGELLDATITAFGAGDAGEVFRRIDHVIETGLDPRRFVEDLLERFRDLIVLSAIPDAGASVLRVLPADQIERMRVQAAAFGPGALSRAADVVNAGLTEMTGATAPRLQLELIAARVLLPGAAGERGYAARLDRLERRLEVGGVPSGAVGSRVAGEAAAPVAGMGAVPSGTTGSGGAAGDSAGVSRSGADRHTDGGGRDSGRLGGPPASGVRDEAEGGSAGPSRPVTKEAGSQVRGERGPGGPGESGSAPGPGRPPAAARSGSAPLFVPSTPPRDAERDDPPDGPSAVRGPGGLDIAALRRSWPDVLAKVFQLRRTTWTFLSDHAQVQDYDGRRLVLGISTAGLANAFRAGVHSDIVRQALIDVLGLDVHVEGVVAEVVAESAPGPAGSPGPGSGFGSGSGHGPGDDSERSWGSGRAGAAESDRAPAGGGGLGHGDAGVGSSAPSGPGGAAASAPGASGQGSTGGRPGAASPGGSTGRPSGPPDWGEGSGWGNAPASSPPTWATDAPFAQAGPVGAASDLGHQQAPPGQDPPRQAPPGQDSREEFSPRQSAVTGNPSGLAPSPRDPRNPASPDRMPPDRPAPVAPPPAPPPAPPSPIADEEDLVSPDDEDLVELGEVGQPVVERLLGATVIWKEADEGR